MIINRTFGEYVLLKRLAVGGQSEVFLGVKVGPQDYTRTVVIKALGEKRRQDERFVQLFFKEAFVSSRFAHPNVITVHDAKLIDGELCLVMDFVSGQTVSEIAQRGFKSGRPIKLAQTLQMVADACDGLHYAHQFRDLDGERYRIVHCDISPQNIMVTYQGVTKVFDFGIAQIPGYEETNATMTVGGKYAYMSPEQLRGEAVSARSDIFSLGIILYELATGYRLFRRASHPEVIKAVTEEPIRPPRELRPDLPPFLERTIMKALERDPERRYENAARMRDDLLQLLTMMSKGSERDELGAYVASLFQAERDEIADVLRQGHQGLLSNPAPLTGFLSDLASGEGTLEEETMELDSASPGIVALRQAHQDKKVSAEDGAAATIELDIDPMWEQADEVHAESLTAGARGVNGQDARARERAEHALSGARGELERMRRTQRVLMGMLIVALMLGILAAAWGASRGEPSAPLELGSGQE